ncbi:hypothetical protein DV735_g5206, partial [Chaetothyriales sp. CBS 134920]
MDNIPLTPPEDVEPSTGPERSEDEEVLELKRWFQSRGADIDQLIRDRNRVQIPIEDDFTLLRKLKADVMASQSSVSDELIIDAYFTARAKEQKSLRAQANDAIEDIYLADLPGSHLRILHSFFRSRSQIVPESYGDDTATDVAVERSTKRCKETDLTMPTPASVTQKKPLRSNRVSKAGLRAQHQENPVLPTSAKFSPLELETQVTDEPLVEDGLGSSEFNSRHADWQGYDFAYTIKSVYELQKPKNHALQHKQGGTHA